MKTAKLKHLNKQVKKRKKYIWRLLNIIFSDKYRAILDRPDRWPNGKILQCHNSFGGIISCSKIIIYFKVDGSIRISTNNCFLVEQVTTKSERVYSCKTKFYHLFCLLLPTLPIVFFNSTDFKCPASISLFVWKILGRYETFEKKIWVNRFCLKNGKYRPACSNRENKALLAQTGKKEPCSLKQGK